MKNPFLHMMIYNNFFYLFVDDLKRLKGLKKKKILFPGTFAALGKNALTRKLQLIHCILLDGGCEKDTARRQVDDSCVRHHFLVNWS